MRNYILQIELCSETTFGRGTGQVGEVDLEVQHDEMGCPFWSGRALKGVLVNECAEILGALGGKDAPERLRDAAAVLFGKAGSSIGDNGCLRFGEARLPEGLRKLLRWQLEQRIANAQNARNSPSQNRQEAARQQAYFRKELLTCLTGTRRQTALEAGGTAKQHSLRAQRVLLPGLIFEAYLQSERELQDAEKGLLAACVKAMHASGSGRNRGKGEVRVKICENGSDVTENWFSLFKKEVPA